MLLHPNTVHYRTFGNYYFTYAGLFLTLLGTLLAVLKTVFTNVLRSPAPSSSSSSSVPVGVKHHRALSTGTPPQQPTRVRLQLHPLDLLTRMSPLAFVQRVLVALLSGELERVWQSQERWTSEEGCRPLYTAVSRLTIWNMKTSSAIYLSLYLSSGMH